MISHELKFIFLHIPKSAGSSITWFLRDMSSDQISLNKDKNHRLYMDVHVFNKELADKGQCAKYFEHIMYNNAKHLSLNEYKQFYGNHIVNSYFKFTVVRNPYDRVLSGYFFWYVDKNNFNGIFDKHIFKKMILVQLPRQIDFVDESVHVVKYENLITDLNDIEFFKQKGITFDNLPELNKTTNEKNKEKINYHKYLDTELKKYIYEYYKLDFELFNYPK